MEIATLPVQQEKIDMWKALNAGNMTRPMVVIDQLPWHELGFDALCAGDPFWQDIEKHLRQTLYKWEHFPADMVVEPFIPIPMAISGQNYGIAVQEEQLAADPNSHVVSHHYENQLQEEADVAKILDMRMAHDQAQTNLRLEAAQELFDGIIPVRARGVSFDLALWDTLAKLMGVEDIYFDLVDRPEFIHKIMRRMTDAALAGIKQAGELNVCNSDANTCHCSYIYTDELLPGPGEGRGYQSPDCWAYGMAQLFTSVSPETTKEFELPYIQELASHFGGIYYGCCDRLDDRMDLVLQIPNIRKISCSPWSDRDVFAEKIGKKLVMSSKPSPAVLAGASVDYDEVKKDLRHTMEAARRYGVNLEIILKDLSTVQYKPERLAEWNRIAMGVVVGG